MFLPQNEMTFPKISAWQWYCIFVLSSNPFISVEIQDHQTFQPTLLEWSSLAAQARTLEDWSSLEAQARTLEDPLSYRLVIFVLSSNPFISVEIQDHQTFQPTLLEFPPYTLIPYAIDWSSLEAQARTLEDPPSYRLVISRSSSKDTGGSLDSSSKDTGGSSIL